jgi:hypothetical protein
MPKDLFVLDPPMDEQGMQQLPWEPDVLLPLPLQPYAPQGFDLQAPFNSICAAISAVQHGILALQPDGSAVQRPFTPFVAGLLQQTLGIVAEWCEGLDTGCPLIGHALRLLTVEGSAQLEVCCFQQLCSLCQ